MSQPPDDDNAATPRVDGPGANTPILLDEYLLSLNGDLDAAFANSSRTLLINVDNLLVPSRVAYAIGRIVHDLIVKKLKHAFGTGAGIVQVACGANQDGSLTLEISDNGARASEISEPSLQMHVSGFLTQLDARMTVENSRSGLRCTIVIPADVSI